MIIGLATFIISWLFFLFFSTKNKFPLYILTCYTGIIYALATDLLVFVYPLWWYPGSKWEIFLNQLFNAFGIYFVVIYFFIQTLPKDQTVLSMTRHIFIWTLFSILLELFFLYIGFIEHNLWWNSGFSYITDWILFIIFYIHHKWISNYSLVSDN